MSIPQDLSYTKDHEWLRLGGDEATVGVTEFAAEALGDVVFVQLPEVGERITSGQPCGEIESTKSVSELFAPASGEVTAVNESVVESPELVNSDPFGDGWLFAFRTDGVEGLLDAQEYQELTENPEES